LVEVVRELIAKRAAKPEVGILPKVDDPPQCCISLAEEWVDQYTKAMDALAGSASERSAESWGIGERHRYEAHGGPKPDWLDEKYPVSVLTDVHGNPHQIRGCGAARAALQRHAARRPQSASAQRVG